jgi:hypothetical protein
MKYMVKLLPKTVMKTRSDDDDDDDDDDSFL